MAEMSATAGNPATDWSALKAGEHLVQVYRAESSLLESLEAFVVAGLQQGEAVVVIATASHRSSLEMRLRAAGVDLAGKIADQSYIALDAAHTLSRLMSKGVPERGRFLATIGEIMQEAGRNGRRVRAFGEMVALLWGQQQETATLALEQLWNEFCEDSGVALFCAYPRIGATRDRGESLVQVCALHSRVVAG